MNRLKLYINDFVSLFFPKYCAICNTTLIGNEELMCTLCRYSLPETGYHKYQKNPVEQLFWGRLPIEFASSLLFFDKGSKYRNLIHLLKYKNRKDVGISMGKLLGFALKESSLKQLDYIIPIPLHKKKYIQRGFNQSEIVARGIADILHVEILTDVLLRKTHTLSQTHKKKYERWQNVENIFHCSFPEQLSGKHVLLVDDVVTTGATLEAAGNALSECDNIKLSIATLAFTNT